MEDKCNISIYNINGQEVLTQSNNGRRQLEINKEQFIYGLYFIKIKSSHNITIMKIIIN